MSLKENDPRSQLLHLLNQFQPQTEDERQQQHRLIKFVENDADCFQRSNHYGHITGSAWIVNEAGDKALLTLHRKLGLWLQLGGHADGETDVMRVAMREAQEESGLQAIRLLSDKIFDLDVHLVPAAQQDPAHYHFDVRFLFQMNDDLPLKISHESIDLAWYDLDRIETLVTDHSVCRMVSKWRSVIDRGDAIALLENGLEL